MKHLLFLLTLLAGFFVARSQSESLSVSIDVNDNDGIVLNGTTVQTFLEIKNNTENKTDLSISWTILTSDWKPLKNYISYETLDANQKIRSYCPMFRFPDAGFYNIRALVESGTSFKELYEFKVGVNPEKLSRSLDRTYDFDEFWKEALNELAQVEPEYKLTPVERGEESNTKLYRVEMKSYKGATVMGWLELPKKKGKFATLLRVPGYRSTMKPIDTEDEMIVFSFNPRDHGESDDSPGGRSWDMWVRGLDSKVDYYYKGLFLDCIRALDFLSTREEVDENRIAIWGGSQGGGLSFTTAALDKRIDLCIADIPYMCDYPSYFEITHWKEVDAWFSSNAEASWEIILNTLSYYDTKNFADKITCPVWMGVGLQDGVCPPSTCFATYNLVKSDKNYVVYKDVQHWVPKEHYSRRFAELKAFFEYE